MKLDKIFSAFGVLVSKIKWQVRFIDKSYKIVNVYFVILMSVSIKSASLYLI